MMFQSQSLFIDNILQPMIEVRGIRVGSVPAQSLACDSHDDTYRCTSKRQRMR